MPTADSSSADHSPESAGAAERFELRDGAGRLVAVEKLRTAPRENDLGGLEWSSPGVAYQLQGGGVMERVNESLFRVVATGEIMRREEGEHGATHHQQHLTPGRP